MKTLALLLATPILAFGSTIYNLNTDHCSGGCGPQVNFGTVTVTQVDVNDVDVTVALLNNNKFVNTGLVAIGIFINIPITLSNITAGFSAGGVLKDDGFGTANFGLQCDICGNGGSNPFAGPVNFRMTGTAITETTAAGFTADILS